MDIAIFGGSFNPVHHGHYKIVQALIQARGFKKVIIVPTRQNPLKSAPPVIPESIRWQMLEATFHEFDTVEISDFEMRNEMISYSYKTLTHFREVYPDDKLFLVLGEDSFASFPQWVRLDIILELSHILVFPRNDQRASGVTAPFFHGHESKVTWLDIKLPDISATKIRCSDLETVASSGWLHQKALAIWKTYQQSG